MCFFGVHVRPSLPPVTAAAAALVTQSVEDLQATVAALELCTQPRQVRIRTAAFGSRPAAEHFAATGERPPPAANYAVVMTRRNVCVVCTTLLPTQVRVLAFHAPPHFSAELYAVCMALRAAPTDRALHVFVEHAYTARVCAPTAAAAAATRDLALVHEHVRPAVAARHRGVAFRCASTAPVALRALATRTLNRVCMQ